MGLMVAVDELVYLLKDPCVRCSRKAELIKLISTLIKNSIQNTTVQPNYLIQIASI